MDFSIFHDRQIEILFSYTQYDKDIRYWMWFDDSDHPTGRFEVEYVVLASFHHAWMCQKLDVDQTRWMACWMRLALSFRTIINLLVSVVWDKGNWSLRVLFFLGHPFIVWLRSVFLFLPKRLNAVVRTALRREFGAQTGPLKILKEIGHAKSGTLVSSSCNKVIHHPHHILKGTTSTSCEKLIFAAEYLVPSDGIFLISGSFNHKWLSCQM